MTNNVEALQKEISQLKSQLSYYKQHHQCCVFRKQASPPPDEDYINRPLANCLQLPAATTHNLPSTARDLPPTTHDLQPTAEAAKILTIIEFEPQSLKPQTKTKLLQCGELPWQKVADQLVAKVPDAVQWTTTRENLGWRSTKDIISSTCNRRRQLVLDTTYGSAGGQTPGSGPQDTTHDLVALANDYAWATKSSQMNANFACLLASFQELIFASLCVVLEQYGTNVTIVDNAMRICISNSTSKSLKRLRYGAVWANRMIVKLANIKGWDCYQATEMVFLCEYSP